MATSRVRRSAALPALVLILASRAAVALAHPAPFSYVDIRIGAGQISGRLVLHTIDVGHDLQIPPESLLDPAVVQSRTNAIGQLLAPRFRLVADGSQLPWSVTAATPIADQNAVEVSWRAPVSRTPGRLTVAAALFPYDPNHQTFLNVYEWDRLTRQEVLNREKTAADFYTGTAQGRFAVFTAFTASGIHHIAIGPDHILFIVGLLLMGGSVRRLLGIVTAFTLGHSVTLALATLNIVSPPARLVEPAIALSIVYVGADNLLVGREGRDVRAWVALFFGLVHGFGFASVLRETGLPPGSLGVSLFSFNLGVEIGQAVIVVLVASALAAVRGRNGPLAARLATAGSIVVTAAGAFWFVERIL